MKRTICAIVMLLLFSSPLWGATTIQDTLAKNVPEDAVFFVTYQDLASLWKGISSSNTWKRVKNLKVWEEADLTSGFNEFKAEFAKNIGFEFNEENLMALLGKEFAIAGFADPETMQFQVMILAKTADKAKVGEMIKIITAKAKEEAGEAIEIIEKKHGGATICSIGPKEQPAPINVRYTLDGDLFAIGVGNVVPDLEKVVDLAAGKGKSLAANARFRKIMDSAAKGQGTFSKAVFFDMAKTMSIIKMIPIADPGAQMMLTTLDQSLGQIDVIAATARMQNGVRGRIVTYPNMAKANELTKLQLSVQPAPSRHGKYIPKDSLIYVGANNGPQMSKIWPLLMQEFEKQQAGAMIKEIITSIETSLEINIEKDVISWIGNEIGFVLSGIDVTSMPFPFPKLAVIAKVTDKNKPEALFKKIIDLANANMPEESGFKLEVTKSLHKGAQISTIEIPIPMMGAVLKPGYAIANDFLFVALDTSLIKSMIEAKADNKSILTNKNFIAANIPALTNSAGFINVEQGLLTAKDIALWAASMAEAQGAGDEAQQTITNYVMPIIDVLGAVKSISMYSVNAGDHTEGVINISVEDLP